MSLTLLTEEVPMLRLAFMRKSGEASAFVAGNDVVAELE